MSKKTIEEVAKNIWEYAEIRFKEYKSAEELAEYAREAGFQVEMGIGGLETAFKATYGEDNRINYIKGDGATDKTLQKLEASAHFKEFYTGQYTEYDSSLTTNIETGTLNIKVVNKVGSKLPATGSSMTLLLTVTGTGLMAAALIKRRKEAVE